MLFLRQYNQTHQTKFRNYSLPKIYRNRKKKEQQLATAIYS